MDKNENREERSVNRHTAKLAQTVSESSRMGIGSIDMLLNKTADERMREELLREKRGYEKCDRRAEEILSAIGERPKAQSPFSRAGAWVGVQMDTMLDSSPSHLADMLIQGSTMGVIELTRAKGENPEASREAFELADEYLAGENQSIERLKEFL